MQLHAQIQQKHTKKMDKNYSKLTMRTPRLLTLNIFNTFQMYIWDPIKHLPLVFPKTVNGYPANICLFKVNNRTVEKGERCVQI